MCEDSSGHQWALRPYITNISISTKYCVFGPSRHFSCLCVFITCGDCKITRMLYYGGLTVVVVIVVVVIVVSASAA